MSCVNEIGRPSVVLMGSKPGSVVALREMLRRKWNILAVCVTPNVGHDFVGGVRLDKVAREAGLVVTTQKELDKALRPDLVISYMFRELVKKESLAMADRAAVNFHAGPLPEFGGWAFYNLAILEDSPEYGCTCHHMDEGFDTGPLLQVNRFAIDASQETAASLERRAQQEMARLFIDFCDLAEASDPLPRIEQDPAKMRYLKRGEFEALKRIPPDADAATVQRIARAFWYPPYPGATIDTSAGPVEVVPELARKQLGPILHGEDLDDLQTAADLYRPQKATP